MKQTDNIKKWIGSTIEIKWGTSRGVNTYGYTTCVLRADGTKYAACNGGGYDMRGTVIGDFIARAFPAELRKLRQKDMPEHDHWERAAKPSRYCGTPPCDGEVASDLFDYTVAPESAPCPKCGGWTRPSQREGKRVIDGRYFYGLTFHDPHFDPSKAVIGKDCSDRTLTKGNVGSKGKTVGEAEAAGESLGLERLQAVYSASSKFATKRHIIPSIDGACGQSSVRQIYNAIGIELEQVHDSKKLDVYRIRALVVPRAKRVKKVEVAL